MLTGYKINGREIAIDTSSKINQRTSDYFKPVSGNSYVTGCGQVSTLSKINNDIYYNSPDSGYKSFVSYGSSTYGGMNDLSLSTSGDYYFKFSNNQDRLMLQYSETHSGQNLSGTITTISTYKLYNGNFPESVKLWFAICSGGGGGKYYASVAMGSQGGGGGASCIFSYTFTDFSIMVHIHLGAGGNGGSTSKDHFESTDATNGGDSYMDIGHYTKGAWEWSNFCYLTGGTAGKIAPNVGTPGTGGKVTTGAPQSDAILGINGYFSGSQGGNGGSPSSFNGSSGGVLSLPYAGDYQFLYNLGNRRINVAGGSGSNAGSVGGGSCNFYSSSPGAGSSVNSINATLGSGGGAYEIKSGLYGYGNGGFGGSGACHVWVSGSNHYEVDENITAYIKATQMLSIYRFVFPYDLNDSSTIEITYHRLGSSSVTETKTVSAWQSFSVIGQLILEKAIIKSI